MMETVTVAIDPFWTLTVALAVDAAIGRSAWSSPIIGAIRNPVGRLIDWLELRLNRVSRPAADRTIRGAVVLAALIAAAWAVGSIVDGFLAGTFGQIVRILLVATFFAQRSTFDHARSALASMDSGDNASSDDVHAKHRGITRELASRFGDSIVLPALMYAVFNLPGLFAYGVAMIAANRWPPQDAFAALLRRIMHMANLIAGAPAALIIIVASTFCPGGSPWRAFGVTWRSPSPLPDGQPSWPLAALAGALNLSFEGKSSWIGNGRARLTAHDVRSTFYLFVIACLLHLIIWAIFGVLLVG